MNDQLRGIRTPWWLAAMYALLLIAALSLFLLVVQDVLTVVEAEGGELHHLVIFDLAWPVFLVAGVSSLLTAVAALVIGRLRRDARLTRYGLWAVGLLVAAILVIVITENLQVEGTTHS